MRKKRSSIQSLQQQNNRINGWKTCERDAFFAVLTDFNFVNKAGFIAKKQITLIVWHKSDGRAVLNFRVGGQLPKALVGQVEDENVVSGVVDEIENREEIYVNKLDR